jgi:TPR repeat protein
MFIESTASPARRLQWHGLAFAALLAAFWALPSAAAVTGTPTRLPETENEKEVFDAIRNNQFQTAINALLKAPEGKRVEIAELADEHGMTALHWTAQNRNAAAMRWLLDKGAELELKDDQGRTPLKIALDNQDTRVMTLLIARGASTTTALPGHEEKLKALKETDDIVDLMIWSAAADATDTPAAAVALYQKACSTRQPLPCLKLGLRYNRGDGVPKDLAKAAALYGTACDADAETVQACHWLAYLLMTGEGVPKDSAKAVALYTKACDGGYTNGCYILGLFYNEGKQLAKDDAKAVALLTRACDGWILRACTDLGFLYRHGQGVTKDVSKAVGLYSKACSSAEPNACLSLGLMYRRGEDVPKDLAKAATLFSAACDAGDAQACHNIASMNSLGEGVPKDTAKAVTLYQKACDGKYAASCGVLGAFYYLGDNLPKDLAKAAALFERACDGDSATGCHLLSLSYSAGDGVAIDKAKAATLLAKACKLGEQKACAGQAAAAPTNAAPAAAKAATGFAVLKVRLGSDTVASVERDIKARGGTTASGGGGSGQGKFTLNALSGDYPEVGPTFMAVNYDFDAAGPTGRLIAVTIVRKTQTGAPYATLVAARKAEIEKAIGPLQQKSATELSTQAAGIQVSLFVVADTGFLYEQYRLPK